MTSVRVKIRFHKIVILLQVVVLVAPVFLRPFETAQALEIGIRSVRLSSSTIGASAQHRFSFTIPSNQVIGSMMFEYCTNSPFIFDACVPPTGLDLSAVVLGLQSGNTGFSISAPDSTANKIVLTRAAVAGSITPSVYRFDTILNPTTANQTTFVRIASFISTDGSGVPNDYGAVAFATTQSFEVSAYVPPFLIFCVGVSVTLNCSSATGTHIDIGELQRTITTTATMQFSGATNDGTGYTTYLNGLTMTSGNNIINALSAGGVSVVGTSQFGLNLRANSNPSVGQDPIGIGSSIPSAGYANSNVFRFGDGEVLTNSSTSTDFRLFTASFIVNVPPNQNPGVYATTMTYTAIASF